MRFHIPNNEVDQYYADKEKEKEAAGKTKEDGEDQSEEEDDVTASKLFNDRIV